MCKTTSALAASLTQTASLLSQIQTSSSASSASAEESNLSRQEVDAALKVYKELQRLLSLSTRTGDWTSKANKLQYRVPNEEFHETYKAMMQEFETAEASMRQVLEEQPAAVRPLGRESLAEVSDFFILDNSLRETTVGAPRGHTLEEKHKIVDAIADSGLEEVILGAFGTKISADSQIASRWTTLGKSFDNTWGFSSAYDVEPYDQDPLWEDYRKFVEKVKDGTAKYHEDDQEYYVPRLKPKFTYDDDDLELFKLAFKDFPQGAFGGKSPEEVLKMNENESGRIPMGLLMMAGYGICNSIIEVDVTYENFDHQNCDMIGRLRMLMEWCRENLPKRTNVKEGESPDARIFVNFTDFANWKNSVDGGGLEKVLFLIHSLSSLPPAEQPFGYMMEDPTAWLFPDELGKYVRMVRLMMDRAGHKNGKFLVHIHMYFGLAEANVLACMVNGADGVWAAMCKVGAQVGHACSTVTATNLVRAGHTELADKFDLKKMCKAARQIHSVSTRQPCPTHEEVYGEKAFDVAFMMIAVPHCRYALSVLLEKLGVDQREVRINELSTVKEIKTAMEQTFGPPELTGWDPIYCDKMWQAIHNHLLSGLSRDYNSPLGLGHLYGLVSKMRLPSRMTRIMLKHSDIPDLHPTVVEFVTRWNRLCARYEGEELPIPGTLARSCMMYAQPITLAPRRRSIPFNVWIKDVVVDNHVMKPIPKLFKRYVCKLMIEKERELQGTREPTMDFFDLILQLKLFIVEAESLGVLPLVDDFSVRKNHDFFFGEDHLWLREVRGSRPKTVNQLLRAHIDFYPRFYTTQGNHALLRCIRAAAKRVADNKAISDDLQWLREGDDGMALGEVAADSSHMDMRIHSNFQSMRNLFRRGSSRNYSSRQSVGSRRNPSSRQSVRRSGVSANTRGGFSSSDIQIRDESLVRFVKHSASSRVLDPRIMGEISEATPVVAEEDDSDHAYTSREFYHRVHDIITERQADEHFADDFSRFLDRESGLIEEEEEVTPFGSSNTTTTTTRTTRNNPPQEAAASERTTRRRNKQKKQRRGIRGPSFWKNWIFRKSSAVST